MNVKTTIKSSFSLFEPLSRGDVYYNIQGSTPDEAIISLVKVSRLPKSINKELLKNALLDREHLGTTSIGEGFAIPHSRKQMVSNEENTIVTIGYLDTLIEWNAIDGRPVSTIFLLLSAGVQNHLAILSSIANLAAKEEFQSFLKKCPSKIQLLEYFKNMPTKI